MSKFIIFVSYLLFFASLSSIQAQQYQGYNTSNFSGVTGIYENPANLGDARFILDLNLLSTEFNFNNNFISYNTNLLVPANNPILDTIYNDAFQQFRADQFIQNEWEQMDQTRIYQSLNLQGPSAMFTIGKHGFAITSGIRQYTHIDNLDPRTADFALSELEDQSNWNIDLNNQKMNVVSAGWAEFGIGYGREIINTGEHFLKGGVHFKALISMYSGYFYADELVVNFKNDDTVRVRVSDVRFGFSNNLTDDILGETFSSFNNFINRAGFAADFGFVYEWRPKHKSYDHPYKDGKQVRHKNKYKLKLGFSVADIGGLAFDRGLYGASFEGSTSGEWDLDTFAAAAAGVASFGELMNDTFNMTTNRDPYTLRLPTSVSLQIDYNIWRCFYVNFSARFAASQQDAPLQMHALNAFTLTPRVELPQLDLGFPVTVDGFTNVTAGVYLRLGPLFVGSTNCWNILAGPNVRGVNLYGGLKIPITFSKPKKPKEISVEEIADEPIILDKDVPMPDTADVVIDQNEVDQQAEADKKWMEDQQKDNVETPAPEPEPTPAPEPEPTPAPEPEPTPAPEPEPTPAPEPEPTPAPEPEPIPAPEPEPIPAPDYYEAKSNETIVEENRAYFQSNSAWVSTAGKAVLSTLAQKINSEGRYYAIIHGHTDNVGDPEANKRLAAKRANAVLAYLIEQGVDQSRLKILAQGEDKPVAANDTEEGRGLNRRVEVLLLKKEN